MKKLSNKGEAGQSSQAGAERKRRAPAASGSARPAKPRAAARPAERTEELRFKVTPEVKRDFKRAAKEAALKKGDLLQRLLAGWSTAPANDPARPKARR